MSRLTDAPIPLLPAGEHLTTAFTVLLVVHILAGLTGVIVGAVAAVSRKRRGRHPGSAPSTTPGLGRFPYRDGDGRAALGGGPPPGRAGDGVLRRCVGRLCRAQIRWTGWLGYHIVGMGLSYIVLLTAFYVDNGPRLPVWDHLPAITYWMLPSLIGVPVMIRAVRRYMWPADINRGDPQTVDEP